ncbi:NnrU family protein [uncultured Roseovarius sp.]|uniref:NnrU family protein n=1 Tax=uncultured Roseovarius sp. TaxID=293344 RepID=UPI00345C20EE
MPMLGTFAVFASSGGRLIDRRKQRAMGDDWQRMRSTTIPARVSAYTPGMEFGLRLAAGLVLHAGLIWFHPHLFGVSTLR